MSRYSSTERFFNCLARSNDPMDQSTLLHHIHLFQVKLRLCMCAPPQSIHEWISRMGPMVIRSKPEKVFDRMFQNLGPEPQRRLGDLLRGNEQATTDQAFLRRNSFARCTRPRTTGASVRFLFVPFVNSPTRLWIDSIIDSATLSEPNRLQQIAIRSSWLCTNISNSRSGRSQQRTWIRWRRCSRSRRPLRRSSIVDS